MQIFFKFLILTILASSSAYAQSPIYPKSKDITNIRFKMNTLRNVCPGNGATASESDNWTITWAADDHQYTSFGDGMGFSTANKTRASLGVARVEGGKSNYSCFDTFKTGTNAPGWAGKSLGILAIGNTLYMFRNGNGSNNGAFLQTEVYVSNNSGKSFQYTGVRWTDSDFSSSRGFYSPTYLQFGKGYSGTRDNYVYIYANEEQNSTWDIQKPGKISLLRVDKSSLGTKSAYQYFTGLDANNTPSWSNDVTKRSPVFQDTKNGIMRTSVSYNAGLKKYILVTQQVGRMSADNYHIGIYEAPEPWGPWSTILFDNPKNVGPNLNNGAKTVYWNFSNKWLSADGKNFVMVYTGPGPDEWGTVEGEFVVAADPTPPPPLTVAISAPNNQAVVSAITKIAVNTSDNQQVSRIDLLLNNVSLGKLTSAPYELNLDTRPYADGRYTLKATALDLSGRSSSRSIDIIIENTVADNSSPQIQIVSPTTNDTVKGNIDVIVQITEDRAFSNSKSFLDNQMIFETNQENHQFDLQTSDYPDGLHLLRVEATDQAQNKSEKQIQLNIQNPPGSVESMSLQVIKEEVQ